MQALWIMPLQKNDYINILSNSNMQFRISPLVIEKHL